MVEEPREIYEAINHKKAFEIVFENLKIPNLMMDYIYNYNNDEQDIFTKVARYHIEFEKIHPFEDGNGRTGRLLINYELIKNNLPPVVIEKEGRVKYFEFLRNNDIKGFAEWLKELSIREEERMKKFGYI